MTVVQKFGGHLSPLAKWKCEEVIDVNMYACFAEKFKVLSSFSEVGKFQDDYHMFGFWGPLGATYGRFFFDLFWRIFALKTGPKVLATSAASTLGPVLSTKMRQVRSENKTDLILLLYIVPDQGPTLMDLYICAKTVFGPSGILYFVCQHLDHVNNGTRCAPAANILYIYIYIYYVYI